MGVVTSRIRLYALAKELKIDIKRLMEEVRREGAHVSVPSNQISKAVADRIRDRFRPKVVPVRKSQPVNLTFRPFARLLSDTPEAEPSVRSSTQNPLRRLVPFQPKPTKTYDEPAKKATKQTEKRVVVRQKKAAPSLSKSKQTPAALASDCPMCRMAFPLQFEMRRHLFSVHGYVLTKFGLAKASLGALKQLSNTGKTKKHKTVVKRKIKVNQARKPPKERIGALAPTTLAMLYEMSFVKLRARILHNLKSGGWDAAPTEYLRLLHLRTTLKYEIDLAGGRLLRIEVVPASKRSGLPFRPKRLNWQLLPPGTNGFSTIVQYYEQLSKYRPDVGYDLERLHKAFSLQPDETYVGLDEFQGYVVFYFQDSCTAVLDCPIIGNAIYVFGENWKNLARLSKSELLNRRSRELERIIHRGSWFVRLKATVSRRSRQAVRL